MLTTSLGPAGTTGGSAIRPTGESRVHIRPATRSDTMDLAKLINHAGEGIPLYFWQRARAEGQCPWEYGASRAGRDHGSFSYRNSKIAMAGDAVAGCLVSYVIDAAASREEYAEMPPMFVPIQRLEDRAAGTDYLSVLAVFPCFRGCGIGSFLITNSLGSDSRDQTLVVSDGNPGAIRLYSRHGFQPEATERMVREDWAGAGENWVLMRRPVPATGRGRL